PRDHGPGRAGRAAYRRSAPARHDPVAPGGADTGDAAAAAVGAAHVLAAADLRRIAPDGRRPGPPAGDPASARAGGGGEGAAVRPKGPDEIGLLFCTTPHPGPLPQGGREYFSVVVIPSA